jgi:hypothetical protein
MDHSVRWRTVSRIQPSGVAHVVCAKASDAQRGVHAV